MPSSGSAVADEVILECDVQEALKNHKGPECILDSYSIEEFIKKGDNHEGCIARLKVNCTQAGETTAQRYVVKLYSATSELLSTLYGHLFDMETHFYKVLLPKLNEGLKDLGEPLLVTPECYHVAIKEGSAAIYMNDLSHQGYKHHDKSAPFDEAHTTLVVQELAKFHAACRILFQKEDVTIANYETKYPKLSTHLGVMKKTLLDNNIDILEAVLKSSELICNKIPEYSCVADFIKSIKNINEKWDQLVLPSEAYITIRQGNIKSSNLLFKYDLENKPVSVALVGFQVISIGSNVLDLIQVIYPTMESKKRVECTGKLLEAYEAVYKNVCTKGKAPFFTKEELQDEYESKKLFAFIMSVCLVPLSMQTETFPLNFLNLFTPGPVREEEVRKYNEHVAENMKNHPMLRSRFLDLMDHFQFEGLFEGTS